MKYTKRSISIILAVLVLMSMTLPAVADESYPVLTASVVEVQKYGNLTMDISPSEFYDSGYETGDMLEITVGEEVLEAPFVTSYSDVDTGSLLVRDDKDNDILVIAINMGDFSTTYDVQVGDEISFSLLEKEGYLSEYLLHQLTRTYDRDDYSTDSIFANFRSIATTGINPGVIYRSSSPVNNQISRAAYTDALSEAVGINTVINLADSTEEIEGYITEEDFQSDYYKSLYDNGQVINLNMGVDLKGENFGEKLAEGLRFLSENEGPYLLHCTEGKDRAGFASALLEALMGASLEEVVDDYMTTYENYYNVEVGDEQYDAIAESNIITSFTTILAKQEKGSDISEVDFQKAAEDYLLGIGMTEDEIAALKDKLAVESIYKAPKAAGEILEIEKYGHASTDILIEDFYALGFEEGDIVTAVFDNGFVLEAPFLDGYYVDPGQALVRAYPGHTYVAVCINYGKLNEIADVEVGDKLTIMLTEAEGYKLEYEVRNLERTNNREDYATDEEFANFRVVDMGDIAEGMLYRSSSPINNELGRAMYADNLIKDVGVMTIVNMADLPEDISEYKELDPDASPYYSKLYDDGKVITLGMGIAYDSDEFRENVIKGLNFMAENDAPYHFHCTEGKDRAGFLSALVGSVMGATQDEIVEDYMESYINYYGIEEESDKYNLIKEDILAMLKVIAGSEDLDTADLEANAQVYLVEGGMELDALNTLKAKLDSTYEEDEVVDEDVDEEPEEVPEVVPQEDGDVITYTVVSGDCLWAIAQTYLGDGARYDEIYELNKDKIDHPDLIYIGQVFDIPKK